MDNVRIVIAIMMTVTDEPMVIHMWAVCGHNIKSTQTIYRNESSVPWVRFFLQKVIVAGLLKIFPAFCGSQMCSSMFTGVCYFSLSWSRWVKFTFSLHISLRFILILSSRVWLGFYSGFYPTGFPSRPFKVLLSRSCYIPCPSHPPRLYLSDNIWQNNIYYKAWLGIFI
jgi:hypothetical protein